MALDPPVRRLANFTEPMIGTRKTQEGNSLPASVGVLRYMGTLYAFRRMEASISDLVDPPI